MKRKNYWYPVDNAGMIFPAVSKDSRSSVFRLSFYLIETIQPEILNSAVNHILPRFETFAVELKSGLFWNYLSMNKKPFVVKPEPPIVCKYVPASYNHGYLFNVYYFENKLTLETFHCLSDGTGAMELLKSITYDYYRKRGLALDHGGIILSSIPYSAHETTDMFRAKYDKTMKKSIKEKPAYHIQGEKFADNFSLCIKAQVSTEQLLTLCRGLQATITEYVTALLAFSIYKENPGFQNSRKPLKLFVPVNLRKFYNTATLRNFSLYIKASFAGKRTWTFEEMLEETKQQFKLQLNKEDLHRRSNANVGFEKNPLIKFLPLLLKNLAFKVAYYYFAENINTCAISNLGKIALPEDMLPLISDVDFAIGGTSMTIVSIHDHTNLMLNTEFKDLSIFSFFIRSLSETGLSVTIETNFREGLDELL